MTVQKNNNSLVRNFFPTDAMLYSFIWVEPVSSWVPLMPYWNLGVLVEILYHQLISKGICVSWILKRLSPCWTGQLWPGTEGPHQGKMSQLTLLWEYWTIRPPEIPSISYFPVVLKLLLVLDSDIRIHQMLDRIHSISKILEWVEQKVFNSLS